MDEQVKQIGERLKGLREALNIPPEEIAELCGIGVDKYLKNEDGIGELSVANLQKIAKKYGITLDVLLFGEEPQMHSYFLTRKGQGMSVERFKEYKYQSLASGFRGRKAEPFIVRVEPTDADKHHYKNSHSGQEFIMVIEGHMQISLDNKILKLNVGDSLYFDATLPHAIYALDNVSLRFLSIIF